tara:strand:+ start:1547 stop:1804 length:258 start_codon:yes stop_codon:yes gene_type:complete
MIYTVYVIASSKNSKIKTYVGYTNNLKKRLKSHNSGKGAKSTRGRKWRIVYKENYSSKSKAMSREFYLKKDRKFRKKLYLKFNFI